MAWIEEVRRQDAEGELREIYAELEARRGKVSNIMQAQSLNPAAMQKHLDLYIQLVFGSSGLSRGDREAIAVVVSAANNCGYCVSHHAEALSRYEKDNTRVKEIMAGPHDSDLPDRTAAMLRYALKLTTNPSDMTEDDVKALRAAGCNDADVLDINMVTAYFNFVNRVALGLGVDFSDDEVSGYRS